MAKQTTSRGREPKNGELPVSPPAYFLSLSVENIRCFGPKQTLDLSDGKGGYAPWTIILGDNGFGKTTLLQCLAALQPERLQSDPDKRYYPMALKKREITTGFPLSARGYPLEFKCSIGLQTDGKVIRNSPADFGVSFTEKGKLSFTLTKNNPQEDIGELVCYGYGASRRLGRGALATETGSDTTESLFEEDVSLLNAEEWFLQADYRSRLSSSSNTNPYREQVKQALIQLLPSVEDIRIRFSTETKPNVRMEVKTPFGWVHVQSLSLGYRTLIAWVVDLANRLFERYPNSKNPLAEPAVVLVDEIDLHLHPRFQRILMDYLTTLFPKAQFIATAHSPLVVQAASGANIALLKQEGDHVVIDNDVESIANWRVDQILTSDLFGLESARPPQVQPLLQERARLLSKPKLTKRDREQLQQLELQIGDLPVGETPDDMKAMDIIRRAAQLLEGEANGR